MFKRTGNVIPRDEASRERVTGGILRNSATNWSIFNVNDGGAWKTCSTATPTRPDVFIM